MKCRVVGETRTAACKWIIERRHEELLRASGSLDLLILTTVSEDSLGPHISGIVTVLTHSP
jgi:hypothetical protein